MKLFSFFSFYFLLSSFSLLATGEKVPDPTGYLLKKLATSQKEYSPLCSQELGTTVSSFIFQKGAYGFVLEDKKIYSHEDSRWWRVLKVFWLQERKVQKKLYLEGGKGEVVLFQNLELRFVKKAHWEDSRLLRFFIGNEVFFYKLYKGLSQLTALSPEVSFGDIALCRDTFVRYGERIGFVVGDAVKESDDRLVRTHVAYIFWLDALDVEEHVLESLTRRLNGYIIQESLSEIWVRIREEKEVNNAKIYPLREATANEVERILQFIRDLEKGDKRKESYTFPLKRLREKFAKR